MADDGIWFEPKRYGCGAGLPVAWQGWAVLGGYVAFVAAASVLSDRHAYLFIGLVVAATLALLPLCAAHTRGGWRWRWGERD